MAIISVSLPSDGTTADVGDYNTPITTIVNAINGNLDSTNIASLSGTKLTAGTVPGTALDATTAGGYITGLVAPNTVTALGNRSYSMVFNGVDYTSKLSAGMRLRTTRTVLAPTQCTNLNGTTQYYSKTSPAGMTFTVTCTTMGARKLNAYSAQWFGGRTTGTNGFRYGVNASGQLIFEVQPGNATTKTVTSYQSVPLNKWFRFAFQIDLAGTCQIMLDGVAIPSTTAGAATSLTQAVADFQLGAAGGVGFTNGKMAQDALFSVKLADATVLSYEGQSYLGTETSLISAYSFNNSINDLNANANNLTANGSAVATNADSPFGGQADGTISSTLDYAIIQKVAFSTNTTVTVQVPEGCTIPTSGGVSAVAYSGVKAPYGMPVQQDKWAISTLVLNNIANAGSVTSTVYNPGGINLNIPIGGWRLRGDIAYDANPSGTIVQYYVALSSSPSSFSDNDLSELFFQAGVAAGQIHASTTHLIKTITLATATPYYVIQTSSLALASVGNLRGNTASNAKEYSQISAENSYL